MLACFACSACFAWLLDCLLVHPSLNGREPHSTIASSSPPSSVSPRLGLLWAYSASPTSSVLPSLEFGRHSYLICRRRSLLPLQVPSPSYTTPLRPRSPECDLILLSYEVVFSLFLSLCGSAHCIAQGLHLSAGKRPSLSLARISPR